MKTGFIKSVAFAVGTSLFFTPVAFSIMGCSTTQVKPVTPSAQTVASLVELLTAFGVIKSPLTAAQTQQLVDYLDGTKTPDVTVILADLASFGVMSQTGLTPDQISAIVALLQSMGYLPMISGHPAHAATSIK